MTYIFLGSQQKISRPAPPPPPSSNNNDHATSVTLNPENVAKFNRLVNPNGPPSFTPPPPPARGTAPTNPGGTTRRLPSSSSDFIDNTPTERRHDHGNTAALEYDRDFESRFRFTPIENLPAPESWKQPSQSKSSKNVNVN